MKPIAAPSWLEAFEAEFSAMLRTPLARHPAELRDQADSYAPGICHSALPGRTRSARERLAVYNRQYWFRLFGALHHEFPLTTCVMGAWAFNAQAQQFLAETPPRHPDLARAADGFAEFLAVQLAGDSAPRPGRSALPSGALLQAVRIDEAFRAVFRAPPQPRFELPLGAAERLESARLRWSGAARLLEEDWPLVALRARARAPRDQPVALPERHAAPQTWLVCQTATGQRLMPLEAAQARFLRLLEGATIGHALGQLELECAAPDKPGLAERARAWVEEGVRIGLWTGLLA